MRAIAEFTKTTLIGGVLIVVPVDLSVLLLLKALARLSALVAPITGREALERTPAGMKRAQQKTALPAG